MEIILYNQDTDLTKSTVKLIITEESFVIDGYDRGTTVRKVFGGYGYEYSMVFRKEEVQKLGILDVATKDLKAIFIQNFIQGFIGDPRCFSKIKTVFDKHGLNYEYFSWRDGD